MFGVPLPPKPPRPPPLVGDEIHCGALSPPPGAVSEIAPDGPLLDRFIQVGGEAGRCLLGGGASRGMMATSSRKPSCWCGNPESSASSSSSMTWREELSSTVLGTHATHVWLLVVGEGELCRQTLLLLEDEWREDSFKSYF
nr:hypothetical protein Iba_chr04dCG5330 [Ipomoea batatas]